MQSAEVMARLNEAQLLPRVANRAKLPQHAQRNSAPFASSTNDCGGGTANPRSRYSPSDGDVITLNLVVHVAHDGNTGKYTRQQIIDIVERTNKDFAGNGWNNNNGVDTKIVWRLATEDEDGNPTDGITMHDNAYWYYSDASHTASWNDFIQSTSWDTRRFANVYVYDMPSWCGFAWYAQHVAKPSYRWYDGVYMNDNCMKSSKVTLAHEFGHYLNLMHTFGDTPYGCHSQSDCLSEGDKICDTNPQSGPTGDRGSQCSPLNTCNLGADPIRNYMDYTYPDSCQDRFSEQQAGTMKLVSGNLPESGQQLTTLSRCSARKQRRRMQTRE